MTRSAPASSCSVALGAVVDDDAQRRREAGGLGLPVVDDRQRADDEVRARPVEEVGERRGRLAETHVVGEAAAEAEALEEAQPAEARGAGTGAARRRTRPARAPR